MNIIVAYKCYFLNYFKSTLNFISNVKWLLEIVLRFSVQLVVIEFVKQHYNNKLFSFQYFVGVLKIFQNKDSLKIYDSELFVGMG